MNQRPYICLGWVVLATLTGLLVEVRAGETNLALPPPQLPPLPAIKSPVDSFRALLLMPTRERQAQLATRPADIRDKLIAKVNEYQGLPAEERNLRLTATELRWYLKPLLATAPTNRAPQLALIPEGVREMVLERLAQWDRFPPAVQQMMLTNQFGASYVVIGSNTNFPPTPVNQIRKTLQDRFTRIFDLTTDEKARVLGRLSEAERRQMEKTLEAFGNLNPGQRQRCLVSFSRFAGMSPAERQEFLRNAARWSQMSAAERQAWRELVSNVPKFPPLPGLPHRPPPLPPTHPKPEEAFSTNGG